MKDQLRRDGDSRFVNLIKSLLHNIGVVVVGFGFAFLGRGLDALLGLSEFDPGYIKAVACVSLTVGFLIRLWATYHFYEPRMKVISLIPQKELITSGPFRFSRNPLYLGGNVFIFLGAVSFLGSPAGLFLTALNTLLVDFMIRREEKQLEREFGKEWETYKNRVRRWL